MKTLSADAFRNCLIILKSSMRETIASIASQMGYGTDTVVRIRRLYRQHGLAGLQPAKPAGRTIRATPEFIAKMKEVVGTSPLTLGYGFSLWSATRLFAQNWQSIPPYSTKVTLAIPPPAMLVTVDYFGPYGRLRSS